MKLSRGFTLIESIISIVVLAIAMVTITTMLMPAVQRSAEPQYQVRAAALAEAIFSQMLSKSFDENSDHNGGFIRCGEEDTTCTSALSLGPTNSELNTEPYDFNDVDDYGFEDKSVLYVRGGSTNPEFRDLNHLILDQEGTYRNFEVRIKVEYHPNPNVISELKKIELQISAGSNGPYSYTAYRGNY